MNIPGRAPYAVLDPRFKRPRMQRQMMEAAQSAGTSPSAPTAAAPQGAPAMEAMAQSAKQALRFVQDPAMRKTMIEQYRAAGIPVDEENEAS